jgi:lipoate-protein ligase A
LLRRSTGGGAIIHDRELTYSLILPAAAVPTPTTQIYERVHRRVARRLQQDQLSATLHPALPAEMAVGQQPVPPMPVSEGGAGAGPESPPPFLCFLRRAVGDLVVWPVSTSGARALGHKVLGSAQRKGGGHILQHGSLLLERSPSAPQLLGINDFLPPERHWDASMVRAFFSEALAAEFGWTMVASELTDTEREVADRYHETRFSSDTWNLAR